jgi:hypothetical protein
MACRAFRSGRHSPHSVHHLGKRHGHGGRQLLNFCVAESSHSVAREQVVVRAGHFDVGERGGAMAHGGDESVFGVEVVEENSYNISKKAPLSYLTHNQ